MENAELTTKELKETISRKEILEMYVNDDLDNISDENIKEYVQDRQVAKHKILGYTKELEHYLNNVQKMAAKLQAYISDANGVIKYVDDKIIQRHKSINNL